MWGDVGRGGERWGEVGRGGERWVDKRQVERRLWRHRARPLLAARTRRRIRQRGTARFGRRRRAAPVGHVRDTSPERGGRRSALARPVRSASRRHSSGGTIAAHRGARRPRAAARRAGRRTPRAAPPRRRAADTRRGSPQRCSSCAATARGSRDASRECVRYGRCADSASDSSKAQGEGACCLLTVVSVRQAEYPAFTATFTFLSSFCRGRFKITLPD